MSIEALKGALCAAVDRLAGTLIEVSHQIHARPELAFEEHAASRLLARVAADGGLAVELGAYGLPTSFRASTGRRGGPNVIICCEYDALPDLGHACGHNVVAAAGLGAALALAPFVRRAGGYLTVLGTPAEERGGGKVLLLSRGAFDGAAAVLLVHPGTNDVVVPPIRAAARLDVAYHGRAAHTGIAPQLGRNALDALVLAYQAIAALRSSLATGDQVGITIVDGGGAPNIVPAQTRGAFVLRTTGGKQMENLTARVVSCLVAGARATGCLLTVTPDGPVYRELRSSMPLAALFDANVRRLGRRPGPLRPADPTTGGSTDLGNVSLVVPTIHPKLAIAPPDTPPHTPGFRRCAVEPAADRAVLDGAKAMAMTALDVWAAPAMARASRRQVRRPNALARSAAAPGRP